MTEQTGLVEQITPDAGNTSPKKITKMKRDIFHFSGEKPTAINLEHVTHMCVEQNKITFNFYSTSLFIELGDDVAANSVFQVLLNAWSADVVE